MLKAGLCLCYLSGNKASFHTVRGIPSESTKACFCHHLSSILSSPFSKAVQFVLVLLRRSEDKWLSRILILLLIGFLPFGTQTSITKVFVTFLNSS